VFYPKKKKERSVLIPVDLVKTLRERQKRNPGQRFLFPNGEGNPEGHFLRRLKNTAFKAGLNCGRCISEIEGEQISCADGPYCKMWGIHKFRKTFATTHFNNGADPKQIQEWLGRERIETTWLYIGAARRSKSAMQALVNSSFDKLDAEHAKEASA
jgi:integrase/recombinase XerD